MSRTPLIIFAVVGALMSQVARAGTFTSGAYNTPADLGLDPAASFLALDLGSTGSNVVAGGVTFVADNTSFVNNGAGTWPFGGGPTPTDPNLQALAVTFVFKPNYSDNNAITYTVTGMIPGVSYRTQILFGGTNGNNGNQGGGGLTGAGVTITEGSDTLSYDNTPANSAAQYVNYSFVAPISGSLAISLRNTNPAVNGTSDFAQFNINAFDVQALPEPASLGVLALGGIAMLGRSRGRAASRLVK